ncbi:sialic acid-specific 9-O-acetylesterase [Lentisphaera araneosa HTCC2155]|uniref:Sialic acid-specific 9-O-acetylesterase n=1 Tax=Lentisphaera araneosa HTCC2155 TaxID=313628 RepID=A6DN35_9BACT|nr:sialate O-acetylesterase [Lentisphaera araneosa]EDM27071.1 sialic acid-specific 9-O-acetylesterase [Lentisphaera araneosa HTCC2155]
MKQIILFIVIAMSLILPCFAGDQNNKRITLSGVFKDHAVLQRDCPVPIWGTAFPGQQVSVDFAGQKKTTKADKNGMWLLTLDPLEPSAEGRTLLASNAEGDSIALKDILVGDVWLCAGQSNMRMSLRACLKSKPVADAHKKAGNNLLRLCTIPKSVSDELQTDVDCNWAVATRDTSLPFSAIGYLFGQTIQEELAVPIGVINGSWGGTFIEQWMPSDVVKKRADCKAFNKKVDERRKKDPNSSGPGGHFNGMIGPIMPYGLKGVLWYQGEGNVWGFSTYKHKISTMIADWRRLFKSPKLPFIMTSLAPFGVRKDKPIDSHSSRFAEGLAEVEQSIENAWLITIPDGGMQKDIHPPFKEIPAQRFSAMALAKVYKKAGVYKGPVFKSWEVLGGKALVKFDSVGTGLTSKTLNLDGHEVPKETLLGFEIVDESGVFYPANAVVDDNNSVVLSHPTVKKPIAVRYGWAPFPLCNLYNKENFAAYPFRTDRWHWRTPK